VHITNAIHILNRVEVMRSRPSAKGKLLASYTAVSATLLLCSTSPALADCQPVPNSNCSYTGTGSTGSLAPSPGANGGDGGGGPSWVLDLTNYTLHFVDDPSNLLSPVDLSSVGGLGMGAADGHLTGGGSASGGNGGNGGNAGYINAIVPSTISGTTTSIASGITLDSIGGAAGAGSFGAINHGPGVGGVGGNGGPITANLSGTFPDNNNNNSRAIDIWSQGGQGGAGRDWTSGQDPNAPDGGTGGNGGQIELTLNGTFIGNQGGVRARSLGGTGGKGGKAQNFDGAESGNGGYGGNADNVNITVGSGAQIAGFADQDGGLVAQSVGGTGGAGGSGGGSAGSAGGGGNAGNVTVTLLGGSIRNEAGEDSAGILAQSLGGNGGDGGSPSHYVIGPNGGSGSDGGTAGTVTVATGGGGGVVTVISGQKNPYGDDYQLSPGVLAQSIGGGGGGGGNAKGWFAVGGSGGNAVNGNTATVDLLSHVTTYGINSDGIAV
jgi:hypothetical protein